MSTNKPKQPTLTDEADSEEEGAISNVVTLQKKQKQVAKEENADDESTSITGNTVMGFPKHPMLTNQEIMVNHYSFVKWAKKQKEEGLVAGQLALFWSGRNLMREETLPLRVQEMRL